MRSKRSTPLNRTIPVERTTHSGCRLHAPGTPLQRETYAPHLGSELVVLARGRSESAGKLGPGPTSNPRSPPTWCYCRWFHYTQLPSSWTQQKPSAPQRMYPALGDGPESSEHRGCQCAQPARPFYSAARKRVALAMRSARGALCFCVN